MSSNTQIVLQVENLRVAFDTREGFLLANNDVSFSHRPGEWVAVMGPSGSGKSVLAKAIAGFPTGYPGIITGRILFRELNLLDGLSDYVRIGGLNGTIASVTKNMRGWKKHHRSTRARHARNQFAYIFQNPYDALNPYFRIRRHLAEAFQAAGLQQADIPVRSREILVDLRFERPDEVLGKYPHELSGGMAQRVAIAMALAQGASYIIADECTTSLDPSASLHAIEALQRMREVHGCSVLFITHDAGLAEAFSDRILRMQDGRLAG